MEPPAPPAQFPGPAMPRRHGCLTAWLIFMIVANGFVAIWTPMSMAAIQASGLSVSTSTLLLLSLCGLANVVFAIALFKWQKWGFYGFCGTSVVAFAINLSIGTGLPRALFGLVGVAVLYGVLQIGDSDKGWPQLK